jgi:phosphoribosylformylglycinamidine synthase
VTGGNVSLYNENPAGAIYPTPVVGMIGVIDDIDRHLTMPFKGTADTIILLGRNTAELGASEYLKVVHGLVAGDAPAVDLDAERRLQELVLSLNDAGLLRSAHDCADGGLAVCIAESAMAGEAMYGVNVELDDDLDPAALLFGEAQGRVVVSCLAENSSRIIEAANGMGVPAAVVGSTGTKDGEFNVRTNVGAAVALPVTSLHEVYSTAIPRLMERATAE